MNLADVLHRVEPNANHTSESWARRLPKTLIFLNGKHSRTTP